MIKQFNTALNLNSGNGSATSGKKTNALIWILLIGVGVYAGYKFIENRNKIKPIQQD
jgi:hypothetical protein